MWNWLVVLVTVLDASGTPRKDAMSDASVANKVIEKFSIKSINQRVVEEYPPSMLAFSNPIVARGLSLVPQIDATFDIHTPNLVDEPQGSFETLPDFGRVHLGHVHQVSDRFIEYNLLNYTDMRIVYMHDCDAPGGLTHFPHPLLKITWYNMEASSAGITTDGEILFVSPPAALPFSGFGNQKTHFQLTNFSHNLCSFSGGTARYALVKVRQSFDLRVIMRANLGMSRNDRFALGMQLGADLIQTLKRLHSRNITHGNISPNTVRVERLSNGTMHIVLNALDHNAGYVDDGGVAERNFGKKASPFMSPWEMTCDDYTKRDEVFRAVQTVANWVSYLEYEIMQQIMTREILYKWKLGGDIFKVPEKTGEGLVFDSVKELNLTSGRIMRVRESLARIQSLARNSEIANPQYDEIIAEMERIVWLTRTVDVMDDDISKKRKRID